MIYLDYNATAPVLPEVLEVMMPFLTDRWGNPSSTYRFGSQLRAVIEAARANVAALIGAKPSEIVFTSCATESNNAAINSALLSFPKKRHIITVSTEHSSILNYCSSLERTGVKVTRLSVDQYGLIDLAELESEINEQTSIVSIMWANNETGVISPVLEIAEICQQKGVLFHCDAAQAVGKIPVDIRDVPVNYASLSGHKIGAPKGVGALYIRNKTPYEPLILGGHQEKGRRGGTENVAFVAALGRAAEISMRRLPKYAASVQPLRDMLETEILCGIDGTELNGDKFLRLPNTTNITFRDVDAEALLLLLDSRGICASSGSACLADSDEPSHVLRAMKPNSSASKQMIRVSLSCDTTCRDINEALSALRTSVSDLRA